MGWFMYMYMGYVSMTFICQVHTTHTVCVTFAGSSGSVIYTNLPGNRVLPYSLVVTAYGFDQCTPVVEEIRFLRVSKSLLKGLCNRFTITREAVF